MPDYFYINNLRASVGELLRALFIYSGVVSIIAYTWLLVGRPLSPSAKTLVILFFSTPSFGYVIAHYFYDRNRIDGSRDWRVVYLSTMSLLALLYPCALVDFKYELIGKGMEGIAMASAVPIFFFLFVNLPLRKPGEPAQGDLISGAFFHIKRIMWDFWFERQSRAFANRLDRTSRKLFYVDHNDLEVFQETLTCMHTDAARTREFLPKVISNSPINVLDIGGGDGKFTSLVISNLINDSNQISNLYMIDPIEWKDTYLKQLSSLIRLDQINFEQISFEGFTSPLKFDLVIASHSLYACMDALDNNPEFVAAQVVDKLLSLLNQNGHLIIVLASGKGVSYRFKNQALGLFFGQSDCDATAESFSRALSLRIERPESANSDSVFDLDIPFGRYLDSDPRLLLSWLRYFLRYNVFELSALEQSALMELLENNLMEFSNLPDCFRRGINQIPGKTFLEASHLLPHKVKVYHLQKSNSP